MNNYCSESIVEIDRSISNYPSQVTLSGNSLTIPEILAVARQNTPLKLTSDSIILEQIQTCYDQMIQDIESGIPVYGCNTGFGGRAGHVVANGTPEKRLALSKKISEGTVHIDIGVGPIFEKEITRAAMLLRINMLMKGVSAVRLSDLDILRQMLNSDIIPLVNQYGGIGASGDLAHNCRVTSAARWLPGTKVWDKNGRIGEAKSILKTAGIPQLKLEPKAGLGFMNGDNFSTALATLLAVDTLEVLILSCVIGTMMTEVLRGSNRSFHPLLADVRPHSGQKDVAEIYRYLLKGSKLAYMEMTGHKRRPDGVRVQDNYSSRCISQFLGVDVEKIKSIFETIYINANSASDNPLWVPPDHTTEGEKPWQWVSGGNFLAMYMADAMDEIRKILTRVIKLNDRHLSRLINPNENNGLPANLSDKDAITQCSFKGIQIQSGMFEVYSMILATPVTTLFGVHEENNQDITSHALTSGILGKENLRLARYSLAQNLIAVCQAIDLRGGVEKISPNTQPIYKFIRKKVKYVKEERPLHNEIEDIYQSIVTDEIMSVVRNNVFQHYA